RADVFEKLGLSAPETWDDYAEAARTINAADPEMFLGTFSNADPGLFVGLAQQAGASWWQIDGEHWSVAIDEEPTQRVARFWGELVEEGVIDNEPMYTPQWNTALNNGTQVGWVSAVWAPGVLSGNAGSTEGNWQMALLPQWEAGEEATGNWGGSSTAVTTQTRHRDAAVRFAEWLNTSTDAVQALVTESGVVPADQVESEQARTAPPEFFSHQEDFYELSTSNAESVRPFSFGPDVKVPYSQCSDARHQATQPRWAEACTDGVTSPRGGPGADPVNQGYGLS